MDTDLKEIDEKLEEPFTRDSEQLYLLDIRKIPMFSKNNEFGEDEEKEAGKELVKARNKLLDALLKLNIVENKKCAKIREIFENETPDTRDRYKRHRRDRLAKIDDIWKFIAQYRHEYRGWPETKEFKKSFSALFEKNLAVISKLRLADLQEEARLKVILEKKKVPKNHVCLKNKFPKLNQQIFLRSINEKKDKESWQYWRARIFEELSDIPILPKQISDALFELLGVEREFVSANLRLVLKPARQYSEKYFGSKLGFGDLVQEGNDGLHKAAKRFSPEMGFRFSTFATAWIKQSIQRAMETNSTTIKIPVHIIEKYRKIQGAVIRLISELGRNPTLEEIGQGIKDCKLTAVQVQNIFHIVTDIDSLDRPVNPDSQNNQDTDSTVGDFIEDKNSKNPEEAMLESNKESVFDKLLENSLSPREIEVINLRFGRKGNEEHTLEQVAAKFNLTREGIRQIENKALMKLRRPHKKRFLEQFLYAR